MVKLCILPVAAQEWSVEVYTLPNNSTGMVEIWGNISTNVREMITVVVTKPSGNLDHINQISTDEDGSFQLSYLLEGSETGTYKVRVNSVNDISATSKFEYNPLPTVYPVYPEDQGAPSDDERKKQPILNEGKIIVFLEVKGNSALVSLDKEIMEKAFEQANDLGTVDSNTVIIEMPHDEKAKEYILEIPAEAIRNSEKNKQILVNTPFADVILPFSLLGEERIDSNMFQDISKVRLSISFPNDKINDKINDEGKPVVEIKLQLDDEDLLLENDAAKLSVHINYQPTSEELNNHEHILMQYIDEKGILIPIPNSRYNPSKERIDFNIKRSGKYVVTFLVKTFEDIESYSWAKKNIEVLASKGVIKGTSEKTFNPESNITRADFITFLVRALELDCRIESNFDDIKPTDYYYETVGIAKNLGITNGTGNNNFNPNDQILRQDMMVLVHRALSLSDVDSPKDNSTDLKRFTDVNDITNYAIESVNALVSNKIIEGSGGKINPQENAVRAEAAVIIYRIINFKGY